MKVVDGSIVIERVSVYCPIDHPSYRYFVKFCEDHFFDIYSDLNIIESEYLFLISCSKKLSKEEINKHKLVCVLHESDVPYGRGWSPLAWQVLEGKKEIIISAIKCAEEIDSGDVIGQRPLILDDSELSDELHKKSSEVKQSLILEIIKGFKSRPQFGESSYYRKRTPKDSELDVDKTIKNQFNLLRICDSRFPAFFYLHGNKYEVSIKKA